MNTTQSRVTLVRCFGCALLGALLLGTHAARGADIIFTIQPGSYESISAVDDVLGAHVPQSAGSMTAPLSGHFLTRFDPLSGAPTSVEFIGGHGYYEVGSPHVGLPGVAATPGTAATANFAGQTSGSELQWAVRDLVWDIYTDGPIDSPVGFDGEFAGTDTNFIVLSGGVDTTNTTDGFDHDGFTGAFAPLSDGTWIISETSPGSGDWTLTFSGGFDSTYNYGGSRLGTVRYEGVLTATAHYGAANEATVPEGAPAVVEALGGADEAGGVSAAFSETVSAGTLSVQQVPNNTALSQEAIAAAEVNPIFALSTDTLAASPQIWNVDFTGDLNGGTVDLVFCYDESLLPVGLDENLLGIWHFNSDTLEWEFGGVVDTGANTITYTTSNFSPFVMGTNVPEPSTVVLAGAGLLGLLLAAWRRRKR